MDIPDLHKLMSEMMAEHREFMSSHREFQAQVNRLMERQADLEAMTERLGESDQVLKERDKEMERLVKDVAESNIRISRILEVHDYNIDELDARLKRIEERRRGPAPN
jgi:septal ring factor EnvC (AmiA/AmiB activator)